MLRDPSARNLAARGKAIKLIIKMVIEALKQGKLAVTLDDAKSPRVMADIMGDARRFWDQEVHYIPFRPGTPLKPGEQLKPKKRPTLP
jgi:hypothetical protein